MLLSTIDAIFSGKQELFKGLWIYDQWDWSKQFPVVRFDLSGIDNSSRAALEQELLLIIRANAERFGFDFQDIERPTLNATLRHFLISLEKKFKAKAVLLIDEYDKPIQNTLDKEELPIIMRDALRDFYSAIKSSDDHLQFSLMTGITKFGKMDLFSGANNYTDISLNPKYATIVGFTHEELLQQFGNLFDGADMEKVREWYNGYNFLGNSVYNPFDILQFLDGGHKFKNYWWQTGQTNFLIKLLQTGSYDLPQVGKSRITEEQLGAFDVENIKLEVLLFQAGYLTIEREVTVGVRIVYQMRIPNMEIADSLNSLFFRVLSQLDDEHLHKRITAAEALLFQDMELLETSLRTMFSSIAHQNYTGNQLQKQEGYYAAVAYTYFRSIGFRINAEEASAQGRAGLVIDTGQSIYVIEFKVDAKNPEEALRQIKDRGYHEPYLGQGLSIYLIGIHFNSEQKNVDVFDWELIK
ncbi:ATPase AAA [Persicobacter diffluens]|uniref:ATPase AAA n=2 Tax=Persicobacter diffluens TaxID=981 RepID=A0AAN4VXD7_9BACT|nr:ATPase AAA [Persicobacter diffluens]